MYLKFVRRDSVSGELRRGSLYSVHFQPNEMGGYTECLRYISDAYEIAYGEGFLLPLIYPVGIVQINGFSRMTTGLGTRRSVLHLIDIRAREEFLPKVLGELLAGEDIRIEII